MMPCFSPWVLGKPVTLFYKICLRFNLSVFSKYQVVVEEERPRRQTRGTAEILRCYPVPIHFQNATLLDSQYYFSAELPMSELRAPMPFCVGQWHIQSFTESVNLSVDESVSELGVCLLLIESEVGTAVKESVITQWVSKSVLVVVVSVNESFSQRACPLVSESVNQWLSRRIRTLSMSESISQLVSQSMGLSVIDSVSWRTSLWVS